MRPRLQHEPIYEALAEQDGIHLPSGGRLRGGQMVIGIMQPSQQTLPADMSIAIAAAQTPPDGVSTWLVTDQDGVIGVINSAWLQRELAADPERQLCDRLNSLDFTHVHADHPLDMALERMGKNHLDILPVVNRANVHKLEGVVTLNRVLEAYGVSSARPA